MKKKKLKILGLSYSQTQAGSYIVVLSESRGNRKIPVVVKGSDAQQIALKLENIKSPRPLTHDLFKSMADQFQIDVKEVFIYSVVEGVFYCKIMTSNGVEDVEIETTIGDAITLSLIFKCPLMVNESVLESSGINVNDDGTDPKKSNVEDVEDIDDVELVEVNPKKRVVSIEDLEKMMQKALENEEYEIAAEIRDRIIELKDNI
jgi:bifunctional DNase/RNase